MADSQTQRGRVERSGGGDVDTHTNTHTLMHTHTVLLSGTVSPLKGTALMPTSPARFTPYTDARDWDASATKILNHSETHVCVKKHMYGASWRLRARIELLCFN